MGRSLRNIYTYIELLKFKFFWTVCTNTFLSSRDFADPINLNFCCKCNDDVPERKPPQDEAAMPMESMQLMIGSHVPPLKSCNIIIKY